MTNVIIPLESRQSAHRIGDDTETILIPVNNDIMMSIDQSKAAVLIFLKVSAVFDTENMLAVLVTFKRTFPKNVSS